MKRPGSGIVIPRRKTVVIVLAAVLLAVVTSIVATNQARRGLDVPDDGGETIQVGSSGKPQRIQMVSELQVRRIDHSLPRGGSDRDSDETPVMTDRARFVVTDPEGKPVPGASIAILHLQKLEAHGATDSEGLWSATYPSEAAWKTVYVSADGYADSESYLEVAGGKANRIVMEAEGVLRGTVTLANGTPAPPGITVYAWAGVSAPSEDSFTALDAGVRTFLSAIPNNTGAFEVRGARPGATYTVCAGGKGWTTIDWARRVTVGSPETRLTLWKLYGGLIVASVNGYKTSPELLSGSTYVDYGDAKYRTVSFPSLQLTCAGVRKLERARLPSGFYDWRYRTLFVAKPYMDSDVLHVEMTYSMPGIEKRALTVSLRPVPGHPVPVYKVALNVTAKGFGQLVNVFVGGPKAKRAKAPNGLPPAFLQMISVDGGEHLRIPISVLGGISHVVSGIPIGEYKARLATRTGFLLRPREGERVFVGRGRLSLTWDLTAFGALLLVPRKLDPLTCRQGFQVKLRPLGRGDRASSSFSLYGPPYLLTGLAPGKYRVDIVQGTNAGSKNTVRLSSIEIGASELTQADFSWPKR